MTFNANDSVIDRLKISAASPDQARGIAEDLRRASWPAPPDGSWILIRSLHVRSHRTHLAQGAAAGARELTSSVVDGRLPHAGAARAVRFENLPQMLACLLADVVSG